MLLVIIILPAGHLHLSGPTHRPPFSQIWVQTADSPNNNNNNNNINNINNIINRMKYL